MTEIPEISDDDLTRFIDNEAGQKLSAKIKAALETDTAFQARYEAMVQASSAYRANFDDMLSLSPGMPPLSEVRPEPAWNVRVIAASMVVGALLSFGAYFPFKSGEKAGWKDVVAIYQSLYVTETLSLSNLSDAEKGESLKRLSERLGFDLDELPDVQGLTFVRAQELGFRGKPLAQLTFLNADQGPVALCIVQTGKETNGAIEFAELHGLDTYSWSQDGFGILLVGPQDDANLEETATLFRDALRG